MQKSGLDEAQAGIKFEGRNINNLRYGYDTTLMTESEEIKSLLMKVKQESEKAGLKLNSHWFLVFWLRSSVELNIKKTKIMASGPITSWQIDGGWGSGNSERLYFGGLAPKSL